MPYIGYDLVGETDLEHHGIKGQKWGVRRFRNEDGTLTNAGKNRYHVKHRDVALTAYERADLHRYHKKGTTPSLFLKRDRSEKYMNKANRLLDKAEESQARGDAYRKAGNSSHSEMWELKYMYERGFDEFDRREQYHKVVDILRSEARALGQETVDKWAMENAWDMLYPEYFVVDKSNND